MNYSKEIYRKAKDSLFALKMQNEQDFNIKKRAVFEKFPRLFEIENELKQLIASFSASVLLSGENGDKAFLVLKQKINSLQKEKEDILIKNGYNKDFLKIKYSCDLCKDTGAFGIKICKCFEQMLIKFAYSESNLSAIMDTQNFDNFDFSYYSKEKDKNHGFSPFDNINNIFEICLNFVKNFDNSNDNLFLFGGTGLGKTFISSCIAKDLINSGKSVFYQTASKIFQVMENNKFGKDYEGNSLAIINNIYNCDLLIIDDLGSEMTTAFSSSALFDIINQRLMSNKKTVINSNLKKPQLVELYSDRVVSRLIGHYIQLEFFGEDIRNKKMYMF